AAMVSGIPGRNVHPISVIRRALANCPDEFPSAGGATVSFIADGELRSALEVDIAATNSALAWISTDRDSPNAAGPLGAYAE
ncbi:MAG TPA: hypothetical protein VGQ93_01255, partial [Lysobacter sp.]|nr:hypothetical protein [Lysobacter sp.]